MISEDDVVDWVYGQVTVEGTEDQNMGSLEKTIDRVTREVRRRALERLAQEAAAREVLEDIRGSVR